MTNEMIYTQPEHVFEAFEDIIERMDNVVFENIVFDSTDGILKYDTVYGKHVEKAFDMTQGAPEITADVMQWLFSMLDATANV